MEWVYLKNHEKHCSNHFDKHNDMLEELVCNSTPLAYNHNIYSSCFPLHLTTLISLYIYFSNTFPTSIHPTLSLGLGLYSLFKRMEALGGDCGMQERKDGTSGSLFWFAFPYRPDTTILSCPSTKIRSPRSGSKESVEVRVPSRVSSPAPGTSTPVVVVSSLSLSVSGLTSSSKQMQTKRTLMPFTEEQPTSARRQQPVVVAVNQPNTIAPIRQSITTAPVREFATATTAPTSVRFASSTSPPGEGMQIAPAAVATATAVSNNNPVISNLLAPLRVLVTDDAPTILKVCKRMLTINGHNVETAVNGNESLQKLKTKYANQEYDVLVTDIQMPVMDGIECTKRFRVWEETQQSLLDGQGVSPFFLSSFTIDHNTVTYIVADPSSSISNVIPTSTPTHTLGAPRRPRFLIVGMSANSDEQTKHDALAAGMDSFCPKPFKYEDFETVMVAHLAKLNNDVAGDGVETKDSKEYLLSSCL